MLVGMYVTLIIIFICIQILGYISPYNPIAFILMPTFLIGLIITVGASFYTVGLQIQNNL